MHARRELGVHLEAALERSPVVVVCGARQTGKTTLVTEVVGADLERVDLEEPRERSLALADAEAYLDRVAGPLTVLDGIQSAPALVRALEARLERDLRNGCRWILIGTRQVALLKAIHECLDTIAVVLHLHPLSLAELPDPSARLGDVIWHGLFPGPATGGVDRGGWMESFLDSFLRRDVRSHLEVRDLALFRAFMAACAAHHGRVLNLAALARGCRITEPTAKEWLRVLVGSSLAHLVPPYPDPFGRRQVKAPKLYLVDPGLVTYLTGQRGPSAALAGPLGGPLLEGLVVAETVKLAARAAGAPSVSHWRTHGGFEVDLVLEGGGGLVPVDVTVLSEPTAQSCITLSQFLAIAGERSAGSGVVVCRAKEPGPLPRQHLAVPWRALPGWLAGMAVDP